MDHEEYVAARYGRLLEHAAELGCPPESAREQVDRVLEEERRHIARAIDPDPGVRAALARRLAGEPDPGGARWTVVSIVVALVLIATAATLWRSREQPSVPSLFGYDVTTATRVLTDAGYLVATEGAPACEPRGLVLGSDPVPGTDTGRGATITLRTAVPADPGCLATYGFRSDAWRFIGFVRGGAAPPFAPRVTVLLDGDPLALISADAAAERQSWTAPLALVERQATALAPTRSAMPRLVVDSLVPGPRLCGVAVPTSYDGRLALRLEINPTPDGGEQLCPFTVDLYRDAAGRIEAVSIYSGTTRDLDGTGDASSSARPESAQGRRTSSSGSATAVHP